ncbi:hypothetical protein [Pseudomonas syringae group sp. J309-1]|uniref:hypothetical protein n=1 Tax=Pseudomonas syringae group sp. J309-1 TaxID=3079588 RepID=UPI0029094ACF|nr:hypothetical protein [Pseudomonas syringae group sp. J309-1]MDU8358402.1 hypothetical protein [Pseudomonas syringae group sp. J309-1]
MDRPNCSENRHAQRAYPLIGSGQQCLSDDQAGLRGQHVEAAHRAVPAVLIIAVASFVILLMFVSKMPGTCRMLAGFGDAEE